MVSQTVIVFPTLNTISEFVFTSTISKLNSQYVGRYLIPNLTLISDGLLVRAKIRGIWIKSSEFNSSKHISYFQAFFLQFHKKASTKNVLERVSELMN